MRAGAITIGIVLLVLLGGARPASAALQPLGLSVEDGEQSWHPDNLFTVSWSNPPGVAAVRYRVLDPGGQVTIPETTLSWPATSIQPLAVPPTPGVYTVEVRLEDALGAIGAPVSAELRFDNRTPGRVDPEPIGGWIGRTAFPLALRLGAPSGPMPQAGIRGYAVSIDALPGLAPCAGPYLCSAAETDLHGGVAARTLLLPELPEGLNHVNAVAVSGSGVRSATPGAATLRVDKADPVTHLSDVPSGWSREPLTVTATATDPAAGMVADGIGPAPYTAIRVDDGAPVLSAGDAVTATVIDSGVHRVAYYARDAAGNVADGGIVNGWLNRPPEETVVRIDREPPALAFTNSQDPGEPERIEARAGDRLSGLDRSRGSIAVRRAGSGERFEELASQISSGIVQARWSSDAHPAGEYEFRATVYDLAGNRLTTSLRANGTAMRLSNPLKGRTRVLVEIGKPALGFGDGTRLVGRLLAGRRAPLGGEPVQVIERFDGANGISRTTVVRAGPDGRFDLRLGPGPSREVVATFAPTATLSGASSQPQRLSVRGGVRLRTSARVARIGGRPLVFSGRVVGGAIPAEGKAVELQFRLPGLAWSEFRTVRTDSRGRFRYRYRFADDDSRGVRFEFRAYAPAQAGWPYEPAGSRPVSIRGV